MNPNLPHHRVPSAFRRPGWPLAAFLLLMFIAPAARAQFVLSLALDKVNYVALEPMMATVTVTNRSGSDIVMGGGAGRSWLSFDITNSVGQSLTPVKAEGEKPFVFKAGSVIARKIMLSDVFGTSELGTYAVQASAYHPPTQQYYASNRVRFTVTDAKPFWEQSVGVPEGYGMTGRVVRYSLLIFRDTERTHLYFRLIDDKTNSKLLTYRLGPLSMVLDPQVIIDRENKLHVLFLAGPKVFGHAIVRPDGKLEKLDTYNELPNNRPQLVASGAGEFRVLGGEYVDPHAPPPEKPKGRSVSDRPPGL